MLIFSDKTGTLTKNKMVFKRCSVNNVVYGEPHEGEQENDLGMVESEA